MTEWHEALIGSLIVTSIPAFLIWYSWVALKGEIEQSLFKSSLLLVIFFVVTAIFIKILLSTILGVRHGR